MRSRQLDLGRYDTDKVENRYLEWYDPVLAQWVDQDVKLLEIGIHKGGSLLLWRDYFPSGTIVGVDIKPPEDFAPAERIHIFEGSQADLRFLSEVANKIAPEGFDIVIDDASHLGELTSRGFWHLFDNHLKPDGLYAIEDWGTGYWNDWPDGKSLSRRKAFLARIRLLLSRFHIPLSIPFHSHRYGMVGFIKELVDEQGAYAHTMKRMAGKPERESKFENMLITPFVVFVRKAAEPPQRQSFDGAAECDCRIADPNARA